jgi:hypothetical protein
MSRLIVQFHEKGPKGSRTRKLELYRHGKTVNKDKCGWCGEVAGEVFFIVKSKNGRKESYVCLECGLKSQRRSRGEYFVNWIRGLAMKDMLLNESPL